MSAFTTGLRRPCLRIGVTGRLVLGPRTAWQAWRPVADAAAGRTLVLDMRGVSRIDAAGLGLLVALSTEVRRHGGRLRLLRASRRVGAMIRVTGLSAVLGMASEPVLTPVAAAADIVSGGWAGLVGRGQ